MSLDTGNAELSSASATRRRSFWPLASVMSRFPARCHAGRLTVVLPDGRRLVSDSGKPGPRVEVEVRSWRGLLRCLVGGNVGFAEAYMAGDCDCADLGSLFAWGLANDALLTRLGSGFSVTRWLGRLRHRDNANTLVGSRRNIAAHYDLGNAFYAAWLDAGMSYSSAIYPDGGTATLEAAQEAKLDRVAALLDARQGDRVLEIGCGWGSLAERLLAGPAGHLAALTLSPSQHDFTRARLPAACRDGRLDVRLEDYREVDGTFDRIVSIEMLEAVGMDFWPRYFATLHRLLAPGGTAVLQVITIREDRFGPYLATPDFIQRYIFPGGMLPTVAIIDARCAAAGLSLATPEMFGLSYARTLADWRTRFEAAWPTLERLGFDERFRRMWRYYLSYCEAGFRAGELDVGLYRITKPA